MGTMSTFHHAYNGIPTRRSDDSFLKDGEPAPLDHLARDTYSGTLKLTIKTKTPLITAWRDSNGRLVVPSASGNPDGATADEDAMIPATSLKGVLSSAFEEITQSRFRVFGDHTKLPQFRYTPDHKPKRQAAFLRFDEKTTQWNLYIQDYAILPDSIKSGVIFTTNNCEVVGGYTREPLLDNKGKQKFTQNGQPIYKQVERRHEPEEITAVNKLLEEVRKNTTHLAKIDSFDAFEQKFWGQKKMVVSKVAEIPICTPKHPESTGAIKQIQRSGWVVRLNTPDKDGKLPDDKRLIDTKYNEYIFYAKRGKVVQIQLHPEEISRFTHIVLAGARFQHRKEQSNGTKESGQHSLITRLLSRVTTRYGNHNLEEHLTQESIYQALIEEAKEEPGIPVFTTNHRHKGREIVYSYLGRSISLSSLSPSEIADKTEVRPAHSFQEATVTDRLWGFVTQGTSEEVSPSLKGRIYLEDAHLRVGSLKKAEIGGGWIPPILASPKPSTAQPYLRSSTGTGIFELERSQCFTAQHSLIRKTYPTHRFLTSKGASQPSILNEKNRNLAESEVLIGSYIMPGATLESMLHFEGLTAQEISTILWLLTPANLVPKGEQKPGEEGYFHLGLGKPLGLGTASISAEVLSLLASHSLADGYKDLNMVLCHNICEDNNEEERAINKIPEAILKELSAIKKCPSRAALAFMRSSYGWKEDEDEKLKRDPVSYTPYPSSDKKSSIIDYFKDYEQSRIKGEAQRFPFKMMTLEEEDIESSSASCPTATVSSTQVQQPPRSNAAQNTSSSPKPKGPAPTPKPGPYRVPSR